ncbi:YadA-like family protein [Veillonella intestinalis]|uniref:YadA-like family protein n=1 Tax=Veillonella intestinalis TaxID=2941341 RepID=UPI00203B8A31|nr:YadA-like family protein [Veillonella intestinalis]
MSKRKVLKSLVLSSLLAVSVITVAQADDVKLGDTATVKDAKSIAVGHEAHASHSGIAIGNEVYNGTKNDGKNVSLHHENISIGNRVEARATAISHGIGIGRDVVYGKQAVAIGSETIAGSTDAIAIGNNARANETGGDQGIAIGARTFSGKLAAALGTEANADFSGVAIGAQSRSVFYGVAVGAESDSGKNAGASLGYQAKSDNFGVALGTYAQALVKASVALGGTSVADREGILNKGNTKVITSSNPEITQVYANDAASRTDKDAIVATIKGSYGAVSIGKADATRQIINVGAGSADTDAVNVAQLKSVDNRLTLVDGKVDALGDRVTVVEEKIDNIESAGNANTTEINNIKKDVEDQGKIIETHTSQISDLDGRVTKNTNAINDLTDRVSNHDIAISGLNNRVDKLGTRVNKIGAGAAALAGLHPLDFDDDSKLTFAAGFGSYKNQQAAALGGFYRPNENLMFSFATVVGNSENMHSAGLSFRFGESSPYQGLSKAELVSVVEEQGKEIKAQASEVAIVKAENAALNERLAKLEALLATK